MVIGNYLRSFFPLIFSSILCIRVQGLDPPSPLVCLGVQGWNPPPPYAAHVLCTQPPVTKAKRCIYAWLACCVVHFCQRSHCDNCNAFAINHPSFCHKLQSCRYLTTLSFLPSLHSAFPNNTCIVFNYISFGIIIFTKGSDDEYFASACNMAICWVTVNHNGFWRIIADALSICDFSREISVGGAP